MANLLVVDDSAASRDALVELLDSEGYQCSAAADGKLALQTVCDSPIDLVLLDIAMPGVSGIQVLEELRRQHSAVELPVIMVTGSTTSQSIIAALARGANDYVTKPVDLPVLLARVHTQLQIRELSCLKDEFLKVASHDLKNPLNVLLGILHSLSSSYPLAAPMTKHGRWLIETGIRRAQHMTHIVTDFLDMETVQHGRLVLRRTQADLRQIAEKVIEDNRAYGQRKGIELTIAEGGLLPLVRLDTARITQVIDNLLGNAIKFGAPGVQVEVVLRASKGGVVLEVQDTGPGLTAEDCERVFVKNARPSNRPTGDESSTGLGLAWCKQIVELHGGQIGARNGVRSGAVFWFELPLAP